MNPRLLTVTILLLGLAAPADADPKGQADLKDRLAGTWEVVQSGVPYLTRGSTVQLHRDGAGKVNLEVFDGIKLHRQGTYTVAGNHLELTLEQGSREMDLRATITQLTATELAVKDRQGQVVKFRRKR